MAGGLPESIDAARLASAQTQLSGRIELGRLRRLAELLAEPGGAVQVELRCGRSADGRTTLEGTLRATLALQCQRCLDALRMPVEAPIAVALVQTESESSEVPAPYEAVALVDGQVPLQRLIEDELLLHIPFAPVHAEAADCGTLAAQLDAYRPQPRDEEHRPFAELAKLADELHRRRK